MTAISETLIGTLQRLSGEIGRLHDAEETENSIAIFRELQRIKQEMGALTAALLDHCLRKKVTELAQGELQLVESKVDEIVDIFLLAQNLLCPSCRELFCTMLVQEKSIERPDESAGGITHV